MACSDTHKEVQMVSENLSLEAFKGMIMRHEAHNAQIDETFDNANNL